MIPSILRHSVLHKRNRKKRARRQKRGKPEIEHKTMLIGMKESFANEFNDGDTRVLLEKVFEHYLANTFRS